MDWYCHLPPATQLPHTTPHQFELNLQRMQENWGKLSNKESGSGSIINIFPVWMCSCTMSVAHPKYEKLEFEFYWLIKALRRIIPFVNHIITITQCDSYIHCTQQMFQHHRHIQCQVGVKVRAGSEPSRRLKFYIHPSRGLLHDCETSRFIFSSLVKVWTWTEHICASLEYEQIWKFKMKIPFHAIQLSPL